MSTSTDALFDSLSEPEFFLPSSFCLQRGVFGGIVIAAAVAQVEKRARFPIRTLHLNFAALAMPSVTTRASVEVLREGSKTQSLSFSLLQGDTCVAHGTAFAGEPRANTKDEVFAKRPEVPAPTEVPRLPEGLPMPPYAQHLWFQPGWGGAPLSGTAPRSGGYLSFRDEPLAYDRRALGLLIDSWWPSFLTHETQLRPMGTTSIQVTFMVPEAVTGPFLLQVQGQVLGDGFGVEDNHLWDGEGRLVAIAQQTIAMIR